MIKHISNKPYAKLLQSQSALFMKEGYFGTTLPKKDKIPIK
jgi:hypothetical protein